MEKWGWGWFWLQSSRASLKSAIPFLQWEPRAPYIFVLCKALYAWNDPAGSVLHNNYTRETGRKRNIHDCGQEVCVFMCVARKWFPILSMKTARLKVAFVWSRSRNETMSLPVGHVGLYETRSQNSHVWKTQVGPSLSKLQSWLNHPMENLGLFSTNMWTTPGMRKQQGLPQRRKQHLNICTGLREPKLPKRPGDSFSLEKLKTLPENHQSHTVTAWLHTSV